MFSSFHPLNWQKHHSIISFTSTKSRAFFVPEDLEVLEEHATKHRCRRNIPRIPGHRGQSPDKGDGESKDGTQCGGTCWLTLGFKQKNISKYYWCLFWCIFCPPPPKHSLDWVFVKPHLRMAIAGFGNIQLMRMGINPWSWSSSWGRATHGVPLGVAGARGFDPTRAAMRKDGWVF